MSKRAKPNAEATAKGFILGRVAFGKISAVEGVALTASARRMFAAFDRQDLPADERRITIIAKHSAPGAFQIVPDSGAWLVRIGRKPAALGSFATRKEAVDYARENARLHGGEVIVHAKDGRIRASNIISQAPGAVVRRAATKR